MYNLWFLISHVPVPTVVSAQIIIEENENFCFNVGGDLRISARRRTSLYQVSHLATRRKPAGAIPWG